MARTAAATRTAAPRARRPAPGRAPVASSARAAARRHLELVGTALGWTSVERERHRAACEAALASSARPEAQAAFDARLLAWSRAAIERKPEPIESVRLAALAELAQIARDAESTDAALTRALEALRKSVGFENATFFLFDREARTLVPRVTTGGHVDLIPEVQFDLGLGLSSWVARARRPVLLSELRGDEESEEPGSRPGSFLSVPLIVSRDLVGVLNVGHSRPGAFTIADRDLLSAAGAVLAATLSRQAAFDEAKRRAVTDEATGLPNEAQFDARLAEELARARRYGHPLALVIVEPTGLPALEQAYGKGYGDSCLASLAGLLAGSVRKSDFVARLSDAGRMALLLPHQGGDAALAAADRIRTAVEAHSFPRRRRLEVRVGVATFPPDGADAESLIARARP